MLTKKWLTLAVVAVLSVLQAQAGDTIAMDNRQQPVFAVRQDSLPPVSAVRQDSLQAVSTVRQDSLPPQKKMGWLRRVIRGFSYIDENYVEPQHYNWSIMLLGRYTYDNYRLSTTGDVSQSLSFSPRTGVFKVGPYFGWRWIFLGYTIDVKNIDLDFFSGSWQGIDGSIYSAQIGADVYYRHTRNNYSIREVDLGSHIDSHALEDIPFDGINIEATGINVYYIFNHQRFSYPAAFAQSTCQKISCGSWMAGVGYMSNSIEFDHQTFQQVVDNRYGAGSVKLDSSLMFNSLKYFNINASVGYAYNWVFAHNWLFCASLSLALAYKKSRGETTDADRKGFDFSNFNIDGIGRFGLIYNNTRWYAGASAIVRTFNYRQDRFAANNILGEVCLYVGYNFGLRKQYRKNKR